LLQTNSAIGQTHSADSCFEAGSVALQNGDFVNAVSLFKKSYYYELKSSNPRTEDLYYESYNTAAAFSYLNQYDSAEYYFNKSFEAIFQLGRTAEAAAVKNTIAQMQYGNNKADEALATISESDSLFAQSQTVNCANYALKSDILFNTKNTNELAKLVNNDSTLIKNCLLEHETISYKYAMLMQEFEKAIQIINTIIESVPDGYKTIDKGDLFYQRGICYISISDYPSALYSFDKAHEHFQQSGSLMHVLNAMLEKTNALILLNRHKEALLYITTIEQYSMKTGSLQALANANNFKGQIYRYQSDYEKATESFLKAYELFNTAGDLTNASSSLNNIALIYIDKGKYQDAVKVFEQNLKFAIENGNSLMQADCYNNLGGIFLEWGNFPQAMLNFEKALEIYSQTKSSAEQTALVYNNIGSIFQRQEEWMLATEYYEKSYNEHLKTGNLYNQIATLNNLGSIHANLNKFDEAETYYRKALLIAESINNNSKKALIYDNIGSIYINKKEYDRAINLFVQSIEFREELEEKNSLINSYNNVSIAYQLKGELDSSIYFLNKAVKLTEELRLQASGENRLNYLNQQIFVYNNLIVSYSNQGNHDAVFSTMEKSRAKYLNEQIAGSDTPPETVSLKEFQKSLPEDVAVIAYSSLENKAISVFTITSESADSKTFNRELFLRDLLNNNIEVKADVVSVLNKEEILSLKEFLNQDASVFLNERLENKLFNQIILSYKEHLSSITYTDIELSKEFGHELYKLLVAPIRSDIKTAKKLVIMPSGLLSLLPFETLITDQKKYLIEDYDIMYSYSASAFTSLKKRQYIDTSRQDLFICAISNYEYTKAQSSDEYIDITNLQREYYELKSQNTKNFSTIFNQLGYNSFNNLKSSKYEINALNKLSPDAKILFNTEASEHQINSLSAEGKLKNFRNLHFSVHGISNGDFPSLSSLVLSYSNGDDGFLCLDEIKNLKLNADFVSLSACQSHLGKIFKGEGSVGISYAFIIAGANSVSASLWEVDESSTALFWSEAYRKMYSEGMSQSEAINQTKREFLKGNYGYAWKLPFFWSPFVLYGYSK